MSFPRCRFLVVASTLSLFYRGVTFRFLTKIFAAALLFYNVCSPSCHFHIVASTLSLPHCHFHPVASTLSLPRCRFHVVAPTLSLPRCHFHVVAIRDLPGFQPRNRTQHGGYVLPQETHTLCVFDQLPVVSWRRAKYKQMYGLKSTLTVSR